MLEYDFLCNFLSIADVCISFVMNDVRFLSQYSQSLML